MFIQKQYSFPLICKCSHKLQILGNLSLTSSCSENVQMDESTITKRCYYGILNFSFYKTKNKLIHDKSRKKNL